MLYKKITTPIMSAIVVIANSQSGQVEGSRTGSVGGLISARATETA
jgi:hypothetical protein